MGSPAWPQALHPVWPGHRPAGERAAHVLDLGRLLIGLTVLALGVLFLLAATDTLDSGRAIERWWPLLLVAASVLTLAERPRAPGRGALLAGVGVLLREAPSSPSTCRISASRSGSPTWC